MDFSGDNLPLHSVIKFSTSSPCIKYQRLTAESVTVSCDKTIGREHDIFFEQISFYGSAACKTLEYFFFTIFPPKNSCP
jgi:hypothetical protein